MLHSRNCFEIFFPMKKRGYVKKAFMIIYWFICESIVLLKFFHVLAYLLVHLSFVFGQLIQDKLKASECFRQLILSIQKKQKQHQKKISQLLPWKTKQQYSILREQPTGKNCYEIDMKCIKSKNSMVWAREREVVNRCGMPFTRVFHLFNFSSVE